MFGGVLREDPNCNSNPNPDPDPNPNPNPDPDPDQVRLDRGCERAVLVDWGMARKLESQPGGTISQGSPAYASPEQLTGYDCDSVNGRLASLTPAVDVWSLGATLYQMVEREPEPEP